LGEPLLQSIDFFAQEPASGIEQSSPPEHATHAVPLHT
jgi:hypothetical protein